MYSFLESTACTELQQGNDTAMAPVAHDHHPSASSIARVAPRWGAQGAHSATCQEIEVLRSSATLGQSTGKRQAPGAACTSIRQVPAYSLRFSVTCWIIHSHRSMAGPGRSPHRRHCAAFELAAQHQRPCRRKQLTPDAVLESRMQSVLICTGLICVPRSSL